MTDRKSIVLLLFLAIIAEGVVVVRGGLVQWLLTSPHSADDVRGLVFSWPSMVSVALVTTILWLLYRWYLVGPDTRNDNPGDQPDRLP